MQVTLAQMSVPPWTTKRPPIPMGVMVDQCWPGNIDRPGIPAEWYAVRTSSRDFTAVARLFDLVSISIS